METIRIPTAIQHFIDRRIENRLNGSVSMFITRKTTSRWLSFSLRDTASKEKRHDDNTQWPVAHFTIRLFISRMFYGDRFA
jgi:hypothetical protein